jgi:hypothetical protein
VLSDPRRKLVTSNGSGRNAEDDALRVVDRRVELLPIEHEEHFECRVSDALVPVDERMVSDKREPKRGRLLDERRIQLDVVKRRARLGQRRL